MSRASSPLKSITKELKVMLGTENAMEKLTTIKAIGNIGLPELLPDLERCAKDKTECNDTRAQAVYSMRKMAKIMPRSIKPVLMPLYLNTNESVDVRIASFLIIMECKPSYSVVHTIAHSLTHEPSTQVASFIYSYLQNMARTTEPHVKILATIARKVLLMTKPVKTSPILHSKSRKWEIFSSILNSGMSLRTDVIHDTYKALPRSIVAKIYTRVFGVPLKFIEVGLNMSGIDEIIRKMVGTEGIITEILKGEVDVSRILEPLTKANLGSSVESSMQEILTKTNLPKPMVEILRLGAFIKMFDDEYSFVAFNKEDISRAITTAQSSYTSLIHTLTSGYEVDIVKAIPLIDNAIVLPTPIGMPIALKAHFITTMTIKGQIKLEGFNSIAAMFRNPTNMKLVTDIKTSIHHDNYASLCLQHDLLTIGTATKGHVAIIAPIKLELGVDTASETITMKHYMPKQITPEISAAMSNVLFTHMIPLEKSKYTASSYASHVPRSIDIKEDKYSEKYTIDNEITIPLLGAKVKITGKAREIPPAFVDTILLIKTAQDIKLKIEPSGEMPEVVVMEVKYGANPTQVRETRESSWFSWWDSSDSVEEATNEEEFIPVRPDSRITRPTSHKVMFEVFTEGGRSSSEKWKTLITLIYNPSWTIHQLNVQSIGGPFYPVVSTKWKAMINTVIDVPRLLKTIMALPGMDERSSEPICSWIISGGKSSFTEHELIMKMLPYETSDPMFTAMKPEMIEKQVPERNIYFKIDIDMSRMPEIVKEVISTRIPMTPSWLVPYVFKQKPPMSSISAGHMKLIIQLFPWLMTMNTAVALPSTTFYFMGIPIPETIMPQQYIIPVTEDVRTVSVFPEITSLTAIPKCLRSTFYGNCTVLPRKIVTLENITIDLPEMEPACEIVLAHDCSPQKLYSVISSPVKEGGIRMLKMIVPEYIIEVTPGNVHSGSTTIKINGAPKSVPTGEPLIMKKTIRNKEVEMLRIVKVKDTLMVKAVEVGVIVETNGELVSVKVSPMLHSSICGLCSHIPKIVIPTSIVEALRSEIPVDRTMKTVVVPYLLRSPTCPLSNTRYVAESSGTCPKVRRNVMIHRENRGTEEVCFSIRPVDICPRRCSPTQTTPMSLSFHCLDVNSVQAKPLIRESEERVLHEVANESVDTTESVDLPHSCIA